jgi:multidrug resistance efflux pump
MNASLASESTEYNIIRAPYDGIVLEKYSEVGMVAGAGVPVIRVTSNKSKLIKTYIDNNLYQYEI